MSSKRRRFFRSDSFGEFGSDSAVNHVTSIANDGKRHSNRGTDSLGTSIKRDNGLEKDANDPADQENALNKSPESPVSSIEQGNVDNRDDAGNLATATDCTDRSNVLKTTLGTKSVVNSNDENSPPRLLDFRTFTTELQLVIGAALTEKQARTLYDVSGANLMRAANMFFDGVLNDQNEGKAETCAKVAPIFRLRTDSPKETNVTGIDQCHKRRRVDAGATQINIGSFGCEGYASISSSQSVKAGDVLTFKLDYGCHTRKLGKPETAPKKTAFEARLHSQKSEEDTLRNAKKSAPILRLEHDGREIGRLPNETSLYISTLSRLMICEFTATVIYAPASLRIGSSILLQISCFLIRQNDASMKVDSNGGRAIADDDEHDTNLVLRRLSLLKIFDMIALTPDNTNKNLESNDIQNALSVSERSYKSNEQDVSEPSNPSEPEADADSDEDNSESRLDFEQLDYLYRRAQRTDLTLEKTLPAPSFGLSLRDYQQQALTWMLSRESVSEKLLEQSDMMHPLWISYSVPKSSPDTKDSSYFKDSSLDDENDPPMEKFYANPFTGEVRFDFPSAVKTSLGGILADEMGLGKTIETLSLIHSMADKLDDEDVTTEEQTSRTTLVVCPLSLINQWKSEALRCSQSPAFSVLIYHSSEKPSDIRNQCLRNRSRAPDLVITSYGTVMSAYEQRRKNGDDSDLFSFAFRRIVLDEAHTIRNRLSKTAKACFALKSKRKWVLTGTPIVNRLDDLFSLVHFLEIEPWNHISFWKTYITIPFENKEFVKALDAVQNILQPIVLRKTKDMRNSDGTAIVELPPKTIEKVFIQLSAEEQEIYDYIYARAKQTFKENAAAGTVFKNFTTIFSMLLRLRQSCCHPLLVKQPAEWSSEFDASADDAGTTTSSSLQLLRDNADLSELIDNFNSESSDGSHPKEISQYESKVITQLVTESQEEECPVCLEMGKNFLVTGCFHMVCRDCLTELLEFSEQKDKQAQCPSCRKPLSKGQIFEIQRVERDNSVQVIARRLNRAQSAKIKRLVQDLKSIFRKTRIRDRTALEHSSIQFEESDVVAKQEHKQEQRVIAGREDPVKAVVFTQFTSLMPLIEREFTQNAIESLRFHGSMDQKERSNALKQFSHSNRSMVLLISLKAGGVGLNLSAATHVFVLDPWWSFSVEAQAIDRVHRIGQQYPVFVHRYIVENSVEEKMLKIQDRKNFIASSLGMSKEERRAESLKDIMTLFE